MELILKDTQNTLTVSDYIFRCDFNEELVHQVAIAYLAGARQGTCAQKSRAEVAGSSKKPWRQKGTGRARSGSTKSPIWRSGGVTFAAKQRDYSHKVNKKMYRGALKSILSELIRQDRFVVVEQFHVEVPKTKLLIKKLKDIMLENTLIVTSKMDRNLFLAARNLSKIEVHNVTNINPVSLIKSNTVVIVANAVKQIEGMLS